MLPAWLVVVSSIPTHLSSNIPIYPTYLLTHPRQLSFSSSCPASQSPGGFLRLPAGQDTLLARLSDNSRANTFDSFPSHSTFSLPQEAGGRPINNIVLSTRHEDEYPSLATGYLPIGSALSPRHSGNAASVSPGAPVLGDTYTAAPLGPDVASRSGILLWSFPDRRRPLGASGTRFQLARHATGHPAAICRPRAGKKGGAPGVRNATG